MARFIIEGGHPVSGTFKPAGNKNAVLPMIAAALLTDEPVTLRNIPLIEDVLVMLDLVSSLGAEVSRTGHRVTIHARNIKHRKLDPGLCRKVRSSILLAGPLTARHGQAVLYPPGGDIIGRRRLDTHFDGLRKLGIQIAANREYTFKRRKLRGADLLLDEASVTATENILMASVLAEGETILFNAACEPHVNDLANMLCGMGAHISGIGTNRLVVEGVKSLKGGSFTVSPDYIEVGSFMAAAAVTGGALTVLGVQDQSAIKVIGRWFDAVGAGWKWKDGVLALDGSRKLTVKKELGNVTPKLEDGPWPGFPSDLMSAAIVMATQAQGTMLFFEKLFESRMYFVDHLISMGADIVQCDPHRVLVSGPSTLRGAHLSSPDIRAGMALLVAGLCAEGQSIIENAQVVDRGYEAIEKRLRKLGACMRRED